VAEGFHLLEEALRGPCATRAVLVSESAAEAAQLRAGSRTHRSVVVPDKLFQTIASTETSQGVIALVEPPVWRMEQVFAGQTLAVVLDGLQDPGNTGAIVRAAEAFGATGVLFLKGSASPFHPKVLRASAGSLFRVPFLAGLEAVAAAANLREQGLVIYAAMPWTGHERLAGKTDFSRRCALVIGNEGHGVSDSLSAIAEPVAIPTAGVESLNAAMAASVLLYETRRQRT
jgi:TrmH family RNA methyltransferase